MTLTEFLLARIAEDEAVARAGWSGQADPENGWGIDGRAVTPHVGIIHEGVQREHIVRWHPGRVLAECEAKRRIVRRLLEAIRFSEETPDDDKPRSERIHGAGTMAEYVLDDLARPYADHPDFEPEWRL